MGRVEEVVQMENSKATGKETRTSRKKLRGDRSGNCYLLIGIDNARVDVLWCVGVE